MEREERLGKQGAEIERLLAVEERQGAALKQVGAHRDRLAIFHAALQEKYDAAIAMLRQANEELKDPRAEVERNKQARYYAEQAEAKLDAELNLAKSELARLHASSKQSVEHLEKVVEVLKRDIDGHLASLELRHNADMRGIELWRSKDTQTRALRVLTWPDHADLVAWLLEQLDQAKRWDDSVCIGLGVFQDQLNAMRQVMIAGDRAGKKLERLTERVQEARDLLGKALHGGVAGGALALMIQEYLGKED